MYRSLYVATALFLGTQASAATDLTCNLDKLINCQTALNAICEGFTAAPFGLKIQIDDEGRVTKMSVFNHDASQARRLNFNDLKTYKTADGTLFQAQPVSGKNSTIHTLIRTDMTIRHTGGNIGMTYTLDGTCEADQ